MNTIPVNQYSVVYARERNELEQYRTSYKANVACKEAIEAAIRENYRDNCLVRKKLENSKAAVTPPVAKRDTSEHWTMVNRERKIQIKFRVTPQERDMIEQKMTQIGTRNMAAYLRKIAIDGYVVKLELPELKEMVSLLRRSSSNLNQLTKRVHETGRVYDADLADIVQNQEQLWQAATDILAVLAKLK